MHDEELTNLSHHLSPSTEQPGKNQPQLHHEPTHAPTSITLTSAPNASAKATMRIDWWLLLVIITSFLVLLVAIASLSWLWFASRESEAWRQIILNGRSTQSITLAGVLIRVAIGALAAISTSMIASIAFESHSVPVYAMAEVSIARFTNNGPLSLFSLLLFTSTFRIHLRMLAISLLLFVFASQFTSTMLVSDLEESRIASFNQQTNYGYNYEKGIRDISAESLLAYGVDYWYQRPSASEIFAEYSQPVDAPDGVDDTGPTIRAFLPVPLQSDRETLRSFKGRTRVFDARVVCVRPKVLLQYCIENNKLATPPYDRLSRSNYCKYVFRCPIPALNYEADVRRQLGAVTPAETKESPERQILTISPDDMEASLNETDTKHLKNPDKNSYLNWLTDLIRIRKKGFSLCFGCDPDPYIQQAEQVKTQMFMDIINNTNSPALALQGLNTMGLRQAYHDQIATFPHAKDATTITRWELAQSPQLFRGFTAVMIIIAVNVSIFGFVCVWFSKVAESSLIGNAWQTIAQVAKSPETQHVLDYAMLAKDNDVENLVRGRTTTKGFSQSIKNSLHWVSRILKWEKPGNVERLPLRNQTFEETE
ncbi:hypothetical protein FDECE_4419 [Fusarium decemcellulare]|nr:hypothetical protein FDECE_4419 [Fusarium decemcellulare]